MSQASKQRKRMVYNQYILRLGDIQTNVEFHWSLLDGDQQMHIDPDSALKGMAVAATLIKNEIKE